MLLQQRRWEGEGEGMPKPQNNDDANAWVPVSPPCGCMPGVAQQPRGEIPITPGHAAYNTLIVVAL